MTRRSASRGILYSAPPTDENTEKADVTADTEDAAGETAAADD